MTQDIMLRIEQVCEITGQKMSTIRQWHRRGYLKSMTAQGEDRQRLYFLRGDVEKLVKGICELCGQGFKKSRLTQRFCCNKCKSKSHSIERSKRFATVSKSLTPKARAVHTPPQATGETSLLDKALQAINTPKLEPVPEVNTSSTESVRQELLKAQEALSRELESSKR